MSDKCNYEVYVAYSKSGNALYVGQGIKGRHSHCLSGCSHNKYLNKYYFNNGEDISMEVKVLAEGLTKGRSLEMEKDLIRKLKPTFNVVGKSNMVGVVNFNTNYITLRDLIKYRNLYRSYFESLSTLNESQIKSKIYEEANTAKELFESGDVNNIVKLCGEESLSKCPFIIKCNGQWVNNEAAFNLFDSTVQEIKYLY